MVGLVALDPPYCSRPTLPFGSTIGQDHIELGGGGERLAVRRRLHQQLQIASLNGLPELYGVKPVRGIPAGRGRRFAPGVRREAAIDLRLANAAVDMSCRGR